MEEALPRASSALIRFLRGGLDKGLDAERLARAAFVLSNDVDLGKEPLFTGLVDYLCGLQQADGGWVDVEETAWVLAFIRKVPGVEQHIIERAFHWLESQGHQGAGWGRNARDRARIPYTSWVLYLVPEVASPKRLLWLEQECWRELSVQLLLSYKVALPLLAFWQCRYIFQEPTLLCSLISLLVDSQNDDGGFAPWRGHPCGSDPWCTAVAVLSLLTQRDHIPGVALERAMHWLLSSQLPDGCWPYHYIDEGTALAYWALKELLIYQKKS